MNETLLYILRLWIGLNITVGIVLIVGAWAFWEDD